MPAWVGRPSARAFRIRPRDGRCRLAPQAPPSPLARGDATIWAGTVLYALGQINFLFDPRSDAYLPGEALATAVGVPQTTLTNKAKTVRELLRLRPLDR